MRYKLFGKSGLKVSELGLGAMTFGTERNIGVDKEESRKVYEAFREAGGNFIDTANIYNLGTSEKFLGEFMAQERERIVLATKYTGAMWGRDVNASGNARKNMMTSLHASLKRLDTDYIDIYWVHIWDPLTPLEELMRGLDDLVSQGKINYVGISDAPAWVVSRANTMAELRGWTPFVGLQIQYNLIERSVERELLPMARALDLCVTPWGPLASGILSGKYNKDNDAAGRAKARGLLDERSLSIADEVMAVADEIGATPSQVALSWVRQGPAVIVPLVGARTVEQLKDNLGCLDITLNEEQMERLNTVSAIIPGFPHNMLAREADNRKKRIQNHREGLTA
ncbi:MAG: aldo/keto reductase [Deltaproteobacteria bacterium]|nr:aldo/keto reductase [Deltaproteobacteria bacterium]